MNMDCMVGKTPVSLLHEMCTRKNITPKYDLLQVEGAVHEPIFQYRLTLDYNGQTYEETGTGRSKKEAKHNTARAMLRAMNVTPKDIYGANKLAGKNFSLEEIQMGVEGDLGGNPVGILQELCMKMKLPPPGYDVHSEEGLPHERLFAIACRVGENHIQIGRGKSKKLAKRIAAHSMADYLKALPVETATHHVSLEDDEEISRLLSRKYQLLKAIESEEDEDYGRHSKKKPNKLSIFEKCHFIYRKYNDWDGPKAKLLKDEEYEVEDPIEFLKELSEEQNFKIITIPMDDKSAEEMYQCFIQLSIDDPAVFWGESESIEEAERNASAQAIEYFRIMISACKTLMETEEE